MKGNRRKSREDAVQILYQLDVNHDLSTPAGLAFFQSYYAGEQEKLDPFTQRLVVGVTDNIRAIDEKLKEVSEHWRTERMAVVDRNVLRLGIFELLYCEDIPATVSINEMIELAKTFGSEHSPSFINGILDRIKAEIRNANKAE